MSLYGNTHDELPAGFGAFDLLLPIAYEQFPFQESIFEELTRSYALLAAAEVGDSADVMDWPALLSVPLEEAIGAAFVLTVGASRNVGTIDPDWFDQENFQSVFDLVPRPALEVTMRRLTATLDEAKAAAREAGTVRPELARYAYNPLSAFPLIDLEDGGPLIVPSDREVIRSATAGALYYPSGETLGRDVHQQSRPPCRGVRGRPAQGLGRAVGIAGDRMGTTRAQEHRLVHPSAQRHRAGRMQERAHDHGGQGRRRAVGPSSLGEVRR
jgi:hypothetical protein